jgi:hypothetical protein
MFSRQVGVFCSSNLVLSFINLTEVRKMFHLLKTIGGLALIAFAVPQFKWETDIECLFSGLWVLFAICYVVANWRVWLEDKQRKQRRQEYRWRKNWLKHSKQRQQLRA